MEKKEKEKTNQPTNLQNKPYFKVTAELGVG